MLKIKLFSYFQLFFIFVLNAQDFTEKYNNTLAGNKMNGLTQLYQMSQNGNSFSFMQLSYVIDANNTMFESTKDNKYLDINLKIVKGIMNTGRKDAQNPNLRRSRKWIANIPKSDANAYMNQKEVSLYEGYIFRYIAKFAYLIANNSGFSATDKLEILEFAEDNFFKIYNQSIKTEKDLSYIYSIRTHMGSHWAMMAMFLTKISKSAKNKTVYNEVISVYNRELKKNFKLLKRNGSGYYQWNSTWDEPFTSYQRKRKLNNNEKSEIQDVSHGNQVVEYIVEAYKQGYSSWKLVDLGYLINTLKFKVLLSNNVFADNVNGNRGKQKTDNGSGYKQSMGWMKLMNYDKSGDLYLHYKNYYQDNKTMIDGLYLNLQYYANFVSYETNK